MDRVARDVDNERGEMVKRMSDSVKDGPANQPSEDFLIRIGEVLKRVPVGRTTWYRLIAEGQAPKPVHLGSTACWRASEISAFIASLKA